MDLDFAIYTKHSIVMNEKEVTTKNILFCVYVFWSGMNFIMNFITLNKSQIFWKIRHAKSVFGVKFFTYFGKMQNLIL